MKFLLVICFVFFSSLAAVAVRKPHDAKLKTRVETVQLPTLRVKKAFFSPVKNQQDQRSETVHRDNCHHILSQCRNNGNDNFISGHAIPLALVICTRKQHASPVLSSYTSTLSRLLLFPNHYFW